ncbi:hypothetical protein [Leifsonia naganoensis]|jgi:hypothetical protein|uniref:DUF4190 domain-containing protein n=1 Tax=Leifsonia naganoensis TaxID=150025 RepID=A0A853DPI4_9MICO|nr:hypothetical protein [Leifsonia naganoensis]NYK09419.1 hypothetical protein [Leifsonia naganoensis]
MTAQSNTSHVDAASVLSLVMAAAAAISFGFPPIAIVLAAAAVSFAVASRRRLQRDRELRGGRLSLIGFIVGLAVLLLELTPIAINYGLVLVGAVVHR